MGIPRFYRWLKDRYPNLRFDLTDTDRLKPIFDNFYIDFNAIVYQCIRESGCFLKNKVIPLTFQRIYERVIQYLLELVRVVNPRKLLFIAFDGVAPRAKINQSRDRRFRTGVQDIEFFQKLVNTIGISTKQNYEVNSISPGTDFLYNLCSTLKSKIMELMDSQWRSLNVFYSDCCVPGEGEHKIMDFIRFSKKADLFTPSTTHCVYSPDADVILLTLALNIENICVIKEDTTVLPSMNWTATSTYRKIGPPKFQLAFINIIRQYFTCEFEEQLKIVSGCTIQQIIDDFVLFMAFIGNDFLPVEFCFTLRDNHMDALLNSYKSYLKEHKEFINNQGIIDWKRISQLLAVAKKFQANRIGEMKLERKSRKKEPKQEFFQEPKENEEDKLTSEIEQFEVEDNKIVNGKSNYYQSRFGIQDTQHSIKFKHIIKSYIEGLQFYCLYYYQGLPSWTWFYPFHYTPLLTDVYDYLQANNDIKIDIKQGEPFDPILALMFMLPQPNFGLLPKPVAEALENPNSPLRSPYDYYPREFKLDQFETLGYNKRAMIDFLKQDEVVRVYESIPKEKYTRAQLQRNSRKNAILFHSHQGKFIGLECAFNEKLMEELRKIIRPLYETKEKQSNKQRFPSLKIYGSHVTRNEKDRVVAQTSYRYSGNPSELVFFNGFVGYVESQEKATPVDREELERQYQKKASLAGTCQNYFYIKRGQYLRQFNRHFIAPTRKEVKVPDFALSKMPNLDYLPKVGQFQWKDMYKLRERVIILSNKYFGCVGNIVEIGEQEVKVRLCGDPIKTNSNIQEVEEDFYSIPYVLNELTVSRETLFSIMGEVILLPIVKKGKFNERLPTSFNFGLNFIDIVNCKIVPRFVRCNFNHENTKIPQTMFDFLEISKTGLEVLRQYSQTFLWLVEALEDSRNSNKLRKEFKVGNLFGRDRDPNLRLYQEYVKLYELDTKGVFCSFYSKTADLGNLPTFYTEKKCENATVTFKYWEIISRRLALQSPPAFRHEPQYPSMGSRVILLKSLEIGYVVCIDDMWFHVLVGKEKRRVKAKFTQIFAQGWQISLSKDVQKCWNLQVSYYTPTYWKKAIEA